MLVEIGSIVRTFDGYEAEILYVEPYKRGLILGGEFLNASFLGKDLLSHKQRFSGALVEAPIPDEYIPDWKPGIYLEGVDINGERWAIVSRFSPIDLSWRDAVTLTRSVLDQLERERE